MSYEAELYAYIENWKDVVRDLLEHFECMEGTTYLYDSDTRKEFIACTNTAIQYDLERLLNAYHQESIERRLKGKTDAQQIPRAKENHGSDCARLEASEGEQGREDPQEGGEGI